MHCLGQHRAKGVDVALGDVGERELERSAVGRERVQALECPHDRPGPGPVGWQVKRRASCVAADLSGDVKDAVAQSLRF